MRSTIMFPHSKRNISAAESVKILLETEQLFGVEDFWVRTTEVAQHKISSSSPHVSSRVSSHVSVEKQMEELYAKYAQCQNCGLAKSRTKIVFGVGSLHPKVLFVGEGPGYEEDRQGIPFVGKAGILLDKIMASIGLDRQNCYIANIVKCHPMKDPDQPLLRGNDRPPEPDEMAACNPILSQQIEILNPPIICALGSVAAKALMQTGEGITRLRGKILQFTYPISKKVVPIIPTYHPAALLRNELLKKDVWHDMKLLRGLLVP